MALSGYQSLCGERDEWVVSKENGREHRAHNVNAKTVFQYHVDGDVIREGMRCDFLVMVEEGRMAYLIELKGSDIGHAVLQLDATERHLRSELAGWTMRYRIVCTKSRTHSLESAAFKRFKKAHREAGEFICKENRLEEEI